MRFTSDRSIMLKNQHYKQRWRPKRAQESPSYPWKSHAVWGHDHSHTFPRTMHEITRLYFPDRLQHIATELYQRGRTQIKRQQFDSGTRRNQQSASAQNLIPEQQLHRSNTWVHQRVPVVRDSLVRQQLSHHIAWWTLWNFYFKKIVCKQQ